MASGESYELLDFGEGRRLERFGSITLDRPCPASLRLQQKKPDLWAEADACFEGREDEKGRWVDRRELPERWTIAFGPVHFVLKRTEFGHLGVFPEQAKNWQWIAERVVACALLKKAVGDSERPKVLNLFAYSGGSTLAAAAAGAEVVHVDAAKNVVAWARRNAELSGLADAPIRWITEDAMKFIERESKRGNRYDAVILDPPSYGHGPKGELWQLTKHLPTLLALCGQLTAGRLQFLLLTCHTPGYDAETLSDMLTEQMFRTPLGRMRGFPLTIQTAEERELPCGAAVRWKRTADEPNNGTRDGRCTPRFLP